MNNSSNNLVIDPVCGMNVNDIVNADSEFKYKGISYYFCNPGCRKIFSGDPEKYLNFNDQDECNPDAIYICPMDPEVNKIGPGACPVCGMALEPSDPIASILETENPELDNMKRRFWVTGSLALLTFVLAMGELISQNINFGLQFRGCTR